MKQPSGKNDSLKHNPVVFLASCFTIMSVFSFSCKPLAQSLGTQLPLLPTRRQLPKIASTIPPALNTNTAKSFKLVNS